MTTTTAARRKAAAPAKIRLDRIRAESAELASLVDEKRLTLAEAEAVFRARQARKVREQQATPRGPQPGDVWLSYGLPVPKTAADHRVSAEFVLNHSRGTAEMVSAGRVPLIVAVKWVMEDTGCTPPCDKHTEGWLLESLLLFLGADPPDAGHQADGNTTTERKD